ncbi:hypothetical protein VNI00_015209 [Paramarasmius palmivorus]|uniref:Uncharacterized protein n=1 Tax=Paramarasmius palmivorus TaxID=297713 RepID=A0AAW0BLN5_9AGAR
MRSYLEAYISDQYNTLLDNIISADSSYNNWNNTKSSEMDIKRRLSISYTLLAGIGMPEIDQVSAGNLSNSPLTHSGPAAGAIAGGSVGALVLVALSILAWVLYNRRRRRNWSEQSKNTDPEPFALQISDKQLVTTDNAPRDWQLKDWSGRNWIGVGESMDVADVAPRARRYSSPATLVPVPETVSASLNQADGERDHDSRWRPSGAHRRLPPTYEDAM